MHGFSDGRNSTRNTNAVAAHGDGLLLAVLVKHLQTKCFCVLWSKLKHVANLDAALNGESRSTRWAGVVVANFCNIECSIGGEIATIHQVHYVLSATVGAGNPCASHSHARIEHVANARGVVRSKNSWSDVALHQRSVGCEVCFVECFNFGRGDLCFKSL